MIYDEGGADHEPKLIINSASSNFLPRGAPPSRTRMPRPGPPRTRAERASLKIALLNFHVFLMVQTVLGQKLNVFERFRLQLSQNRNQREKLV